MIEFLKITLFCISFYFTVIRFITYTKICNLPNNSLAILMGFKNKGLFIIIELAMWCYQIYFWFHLLNII